MLDVEPHQGRLLGYHPRCVALTVMDHLIEEGARGVSVVDDAGLLAPHAAGRAGGRDVSPPETSGRVSGGYGVLGDQGGDARGREVRVGVAKAVVGIGSGK